MGSAALQCTLQASSEARKANDTIRVTDSSNNLDISFQRTIRVADGKGTSELPPSMGTFPLFPVSAYEKQLPKAMAAKGGLFFPMYQREAMWIRFDAESEFAIRIYLGGINAVSGEPMIENAATQLRRQKLKAEGKSIQDYVVTPGQLWLDGVATTEGKIRQFVAMPMGSRYSVEVQITGQELVGGLQFEVTPHMFQGSRVKEATQDIQIYVKTLTGKTISLKVPNLSSVKEVKSSIQDKEGIPPDQQRLIWDGKELASGLYLDHCSIGDGAVMHLTLRLRGGGSLPPHYAEMGIAAGGLIKQCILEDQYPAESWDRERTIYFNVQLLNSELFRSVTGLAPPKTPISAETYAHLGLPYYKISDETSSIKGDFDGVKSVKTIDKVKAVKGEDGSAAVCEEVAHDQPVILLKPSGSAMAFRPVSELEQELARKGSVHF